MPQTPRRNSQTTPRWASEQLSANRYAAGAAVAALLAAYLLAGPTSTQRPPIPPGATLITGLEALAPPRPKGTAPLGGKWPLDVLLVPGYERPPTSRPSPARATRTGPSPTARRTTSTPVWKSNLRRVHRRDACSMAWRCRFLTARRNQRGHAIAEK